HDLRDEDRVEHPTRDEHVDEVRELVGHRERVRGAVVDPDGGTQEQRRLDHAEDPGDQRAGEHQRRRAGHAPARTRRGVGGPVLVRPRPGAHGATSSAVAGSARRPRRTVRTRPTTSMTPSSPATTAVPTLSQSARTRTCRSLGVPMVRPSAPSSWTSTVTLPLPTARTGTCAVRSEERRVGTERRSGWAPRTQNYSAQ